MKASVLLLIEAFNPSSIRSPIQDSSFSFRIFSPVHFAVVWLESAATAKGELD